MSWRVIIPARYASTRLSGKPLRLLAGKPMLQHVYERALRSHATEIIIAADDSRIQQSAEGFGAKVCMTSDKHGSGTERLSEVIEKCDIAADDVVVNLQADEPLMPATCLNQVAIAMQTHSEAKVATLCMKIENAEELFDPHVVKVVRDKQDYALYFSRAPIPWHREEYLQNQYKLPQDGTPYFRHIGLYAYRAGFIQNYIASSPSHLEQAESLEQLRVLWHGERIIVPEAETKPGPGIDTEDDLKRVECLLQQ